MDTELLKFTRHRNFYVARLKGAKAIFNGCALDDFSEKIKVQADKIYQDLKELETLVSNTWPEQKTLFLKNHPLKDIKSDS